MILSVWNMVLRSNSAVAKVSKIVGKIPPSIKKLIVLAVGIYLVLVVVARIIDPSVELQDRVFAVTPVNVDRKNTGSLVFIHGIGGHYLTTWENQEINRTWFDLLSKDERFKGFNLYSIAYDSHRGGPKMGTIIDRLEKNLPNLFKHKDTYFIAHSLGGIVFQKLLLESAQSKDAQLHNFRNSIKLVIFLATPGRSTFAANVMTFALAKNPLWGYLASPEFVSDTIHNWRSSELLSHIEAVCARESRRYMGIFFIVSEESARESCARQSVPTGLHADHFTIAKPKDCATDPYNWVAEEITHRAYSTGSVPSIPDRPRECWPPGADRPIKENGRPRMANAEPYAVEFGGRGGSALVRRIAEGAPPKDSLDAASIETALAEKETSKVPMLLGHFSAKRVPTREATTKLIAESFRKRKEKSDDVDFYKALATLMRDAGFKTASPFHGTDFTGANFEGLNLRHVDFSGSNLTRANFIGAILERANFQNACMQETKFFDRHQWAWIDGVNLSGSDLSGSELVWKEKKPGGLIVGLSRASSLKATIAPIKASDLERDELKERGVIESSPNSPCNMFYSKSKPTVQEQNIR